MLKKKLWAILLVAIGLFMFSGNALATPTSHGKAQAVSLYRPFPEGIDPNNAQHALSQVLSRASWDDQYANVALVQQTGAASFDPKQYVTLGYKPQAPTGTTNSAITGSGTLVPVADHGGSQNVKVLVVMNIVTKQTVTLMVRCGNPRLHPFVRVLPFKPFSKGTVIYINRSVTKPVSITCPSGQTVSGTITATVRGTIRAKTWGTVQGNLNLQLQEQADLQIKAFVELKCGPAPPPVVPPVVPPVTPPATPSTTVFTATATASATASATCPDGTTATSSSFGSGSATSTISQQDAQNKAQAIAQANAQASANASVKCAAAPPPPATTFTATATATASATASATVNCPAGSTTSTATASATASGSGSGSATSTISQQDAQNKAQTIANTNAQAAAQANAQASATATATAQCTQAPPPATPPTLSNLTTIQEVYPNEVRPNVCVDVSGKAGDNITVTFGAGHGSISGGPFSTSTGSGHFCVTYTAPSQTGSDTITVVATDTTSGLSAQTSTSVPIIPSPTNP